MRQKALHWWEGFLLSKISEDVLLLDVGEGNVVLLDYGSIRFIADWQETVADWLVHRSIISDTFSDSYREQTEAVPQLRSTSAAYLAVILS